MNDLNYSHELSFVRVLRSQDVVASVSNTVVRNNSFANVPIFINTSGSWQYLIQWLLYKHSRGRKNKKNRSWSPLSSHDRALPSWPHAASSFYLSLFLLSLSCIMHLFLYGNICKTYSNRYSYCHECSIGFLCDAGYKRYLWSISKQSFTISR